MDIPVSVKSLALFFHQDALYGDRTVEEVLSDFAYNGGEQALRDAQRFMAESLATGDVALMEEQWLLADSALDFEENTPEFFQKVVDFDTTPYIGLQRPSYIPPPTILQKIHRWFSDKC